jgi:hypothetical protein
VKIVSPAEASDATANIHGKMIPSLMLISFFVRQASLPIVTTNGLAKTIVTSSEVTASVSEPPAISQTSNKTIST